MSLLNKMKEISLGNLSRRAGESVGLSALGLMTSGSKPKVALGAGLSYIGRGLSRYSTMGLGAQRAIAGAAVGGTYGLFSNDTSVLGGALGGAALAGGIHGSIVGGRFTKNAYSAFRGMGMGRGQAAKASFMTLGAASGAYIGNTSRRAVNGFKALGNRVRSKWNGLFQDIA